MAKYYSSTLQKGSKGNDVTEWQKFLQGQGYYDGGIDGDFGDKTHAATVAYQQANGLDVDGIVGQNTWGKAGYSNMKTPTAAPETNKTATDAPNIGNAPTAPKFNTTATATPTTKPLPNAPTYDTTAWDDTTKGQQALGNYNTAKENVNKYGDFTYDDYTEGDKVTAAGDALDVHNANKPGAYQSQWQSQLDSLMNSIMNREKFSYDLNGDALYQQYKDKYIEQGKLAMADTMGQAAAMTGGYGSSYAQSVGQQAYQGQLNNLNDIVPELYAMALDKYNREGQELYNQYGMVMDRENTDYGRYRDSVSDFLTERDYLQGRYDTERGFDYGKYVDDRNLDHALHQEGYQKLLDSLGIAQGDYYNGADMFHSEQATKNSVEGQKFNDAMSIWGAESDQTWKQYQASEEARQYANSLLQQGYQNEFGEWEANSDNAWKQAQWDEAARQYANEEAWRQKEWDENNRRYEESKVTTSGSGGNSGNVNKGTTDTGVAYDNGSLSDEQVKELQAALGVDADGAYGPNSQKAAGGLSAEEAYNKYVKKTTVFNYNTYNENTKENGGSYYSTVIDDIKAMIAQGVSQENISAYMQDLMNNSYLAPSEVAYILNKYRNGKL
jgi:peptidoglycan hydrolase-like protein with peptidoglycan-binding domain